MGRGGMAVVRRALLLPDNPGPLAVVEGAVELVAIPAILTDVARRHPRRFGSNRAHSSLRVREAAVVVVEVLPQEQVQGERYLAAVVVVKEVVE